MFLRDPSLTQESVFFYIHIEVEEDIILIYNTSIISFLRQTRFVVLIFATPNNKFVFSYLMVWSNAIAVCSCFKPNRKRRFGVWFLDRLLQSDSRGCNPRPPSSCLPPVYLLPSRPGLLNNQFHCILCFSTCYNCGIRCTTMQHIWQIFRIKFGLPHQRSPTVTVIPAVQSPQRTSTH